MVTLLTHTGGEAIDDAFLADFIERWAAAWNSHDPERVIAMMQPDCVYDDSAWHQSMRSPEETRAFLRSAWTALPDLSFVSATPARVPGEAKATAYWHARGTMKGKLDPPGYAPTNGAVDFYGFDYYEFRDGKLSRLHIIFDMLDVGRQIGAAPPRGSLLEKGSVLWQRFTAGRRR